MLVRACVITLFLATMSYASCPQVHRDLTIRYHFWQMTGYPHGRPGYVVDHIVPLCAGGTDTVGNMQWQSLADSYKKDMRERALCHRLWSK